MSQYEVLCTMATRRAQEFLRDQFIVECDDGSLTMAEEIAAIDWARAIVVTVVGPDGARRVERRPGM